MNIRSEKTLCMGCGVCASVCPKNAIQISFDNVMGTFYPVVNEDSCVDCSLCSNVCTAISGCSAEKKMVLNVWRGYTDNRFYRSSGGLCSKVISYLLENKIVDKFIVAKYSEKSNLFFEVGSINGDFDINSLPCSVYAPLQFSEVLEEVKKHTEINYGIVALPCVISTITNAQQQLRKFSNIKIKLALTCGTLPTYALTEYVAIKEGIVFSDVDKISFRKKDEKRNCSNHGITIRNKSGGSVESMIQGGAFGRAFLNKFFIHSACNYCDDVFGFCADASFMDAWGQDNEEKGMSLVKVQSLLMENVMKALSETQSVHIEPVEIDNPIHAQSKVGVYRRKTQGAFLRGIILKKQGYLLPKKEFKKLTIVDFIKLYIKAYIEIKISHRSALLWKLYKNGKITIEEFDKKLNFWVRLLKR